MNREDLMNFMRADGAVSYQELSNVASGPIPGIRYYRIVNDKVETCRWVTKGDMYVPQSTWSERVAGLTVAELYDDITAEFTTAMPQEVAV